VDNDFFFVEFLSELLEKKGYEVTKAYNGKEGISKLEESAFDILFADLIMPKIDGLQLIKFARGRFPSGQLTIIVVFRAPLLNRWMRSKYRCGLLCRKRPAWRR
jgi:CheY-like chemotaxis protein